MLTNPQETVDLVTFTEQILKGKLHFFCSAIRRVAIMFFELVVVKIMIMI